MSTTSSEPGWSSSTCRQATSNRSRAVNHIRSAFSAPPVLTLHSHTHRYSADLCCPARDGERRADAHVQSSPSRSSFRFPARLLPAKAHVAEYFLPRQDVPVEWIPAERRDAMEDDGSGPGRGHTAASQDSSISPIEGIRFGLLGVSTHKILRHATELTFAFRSSSTWRSKRWRKSSSSRRRPGAAAAAAQSFGRTRRVTARAKGERESMFTCTYLLVVTQFPKAGRIFLVSLARRRDASLFFSPALALSLQALHPARAHRVVRLLAYRRLYHSLCRTGELLCLRGSEHADSLTSLSCTLDCSGSARPVVKRTYGARKPLSSSPASLNTPSVSWGLTPASPALPA